MLANSRTASIKKQRREERKAKRLALMQGGNNKGLVDQEENVEEEDDEDLDQGLDDVNAANSNERSFTWNSRVNDALFQVFVFCFFVLFLFVVGLETLFF